MNIIKKLFNKSTKRFNRRINVFYDETLTFQVQGSVRTADQLFTDQYVQENPVEEWVYHVFNFELDGIKYEFKVRDDERKFKHTESTPYPAWLHAEHEEACWFEGEERVVCLWEPDEEDDDDEW